MSYQGPKVYDFIKPKGTGIFNFYCRKTCIENRSGILIVYEDDENNELVLSNATYLLQLWYRIVSKIKWSKVQT